MTWMNMHLWMKYMKMNTNGRRKNVKKVREVNGSDHLVFLSFLLMVEFIRIISSGHKEEVQR